MLQVEGLAALYASSSENEKSLGEICSKQEVISQMTLKELLIVILLLQRHTTANRSSTNWAAFQSDISLSTSMVITTELCRQLGEELWSSSETALLLLKKATEPSLNSPMTSVQATNAASVKKETDSPRTSSDLRSFQMTQVCAQSFLDFVFIFI